MYKFVVLSALVAVARAGLIGAPLATAYAAPAYAAPALGYAHAAPAAITSQSSNILRSYGNLGQVSTYSKTIDTPYSSVTKSDVRVSNPGYATAVASPAYGYAAPALAARVAAPIGYAAPALSAHVASPLGYAARVASPLGYAAPALAAPVARAGLLGVAYSAAPVVSHVSYDGLGAHYAW